MPEPPAKPKRKLRATVGGVFWLLTAMFRVDPPPPPGTEDVIKDREEKPGAPPKHSPRP